MTFFDAFEDIAWSLVHVAALVSATEEENQALTAQSDLIKEKVTELKNFLITHPKSTDINMVPLRKIGTEFGYKPLLSDAGTVIEILAQN